MIKVAGIASIQMTAHERGIKWAAGRLGLPFDLGLMRLQSSQDVDERRNRIESR